LLVPWAAGYPAYTMIPRVSRIPKDIQNTQHTKNIQDTLVYPEYPGYSRILQDILGYQGYPGSSRILKIPMIIRIVTILQDTPGYSMLHHTTLGYSRIPRISTISRVLQDTQGYKQINK
jgi:hypothetical protein